MKNVIKPDPISFTTHHLHMCFTPTDLVISSGTGFIYLKDENFYLITNWHNVTGKNPSTQELLSLNGAIPDAISTLFRNLDQPANCERVQLNLYADDVLKTPLWLEHPIHKHNVDVVAIKLSEDIINSYKLFPINQVDFDEETKEEIADEAFVIGYPFNDPTYLQMPIWKKASIASEPDINIDQLPKFLIDTATRSGLSGSPVIMQRTGIHGLIEGKVVGSSTIGRIRKFSGVYSGRIGDNELKAQLGIVWKAKVIGEIIEGASN